MTSNVPIGVSAIFTLYSGQAFLTEAGVGDSKAETQFTLPVDISPSFDTGVAFFNPENAPTVITVRLLNSAGAKVAESAPITLLAKNQTAKFVSELFPGQGTFQGSLAITATGQVSAITLRQNFSPISYTTLPVAEGAYTGGPAAAAKLLPKTQTPVTATSNTTVNASLPAGYLLSGTVGGDAQMSTIVTASTAGGQLYAGPVNFFTGKYSIVVPAGTFTLRVCYVPESASFNGQLTITYTDPATVQVNADTTRNITIPPSTVSNVSGTVSGQPPANSGFYVQMTSSDLRVSALASVDDGAYLLQIPNGTYTASLMVLDLTGNQQDALGFFNLGSVQVNGTKTADFAVPVFSTVSGTVTRSGATGMPDSSLITSSDNTVPAITTFMCNFFVAGNTGPVATTNGAYSLYVPNGRAQTMMVFYPLGGTGSVTFPFPGRQIPALSGNRTENFAIPALPGNVTISGKVTDPQAKGVSDVTVSATSQQITGANGVTFGASATTDSSGNYTLTVLNGTAYTLIFTPPLPTL